VIDGSEPVDYASGSLAGSQNVPLARLIRAFVMALLLARAPWG